MVFLPIGRPREIAELKRVDRALRHDRRSKVSICIIDDEPFAYLEIIRNHGYTVRQFEDIQDLEHLRSYPIVLCDIRGVGKAFGSSYEGAHLISQIRKSYPEKVIIAYTGQQYDPTYNTHLACADFQLKKDADSDAWISTLEEAIKQATDPIFQWAKVRSLLIEKEVPLFDILQLEHQYVNSMLKRSKQFPSSRTLRRLPEDARAIVINLTSSFLFRLIVG